MRYSWLALLPLLAACNSSPSAVQEGAASIAADQPAQDSAVLPAPDTAHTKAVSAQRDTLRTVRERRNFSNPQGPPDTFQLIFRGPSMLEGTGEFTIANAEGQVIFREMLTEPDLEAALVYEITTPTATRAQREAFVRRRIDQFFQPSQFHSPAVAAGSALPTDLEKLDRAAWNNLKQRPDAIRFDYLKGKEDRQQIAWSPLKKEVIRVR